MAAEVLFHVPLRGSLVVLTGVSMLYLLVSLGIGLFASSATKSQFVASRSRCSPPSCRRCCSPASCSTSARCRWPLQIVTYILPARYFVTLLQTIFLAGDIWGVILPNAAVLALMASSCSAAAARATRKKLA